VNSADISAYARLIVAETVSKLSKLQKQAAAYCFLLFVP